MPLALPAEFDQLLVVAADVRISRIVSRGHASPPGAWLDQDEGEFVLLLSGAARLQFADGAELTMRPGDWIDLPAHLRHRVEWTDPAADSVWLTVVHR